MSDKAKSYLIFATLIFCIIFPLAAIVVVAVVLGTFFIIYLPALVLDLMCGEFSRKKDSEGG